MTAIDDRLAGCFANAFPELGPIEIPSAAVDTVAEWDSLRAVVLVALLEETFDVRIPARDYPRLRSYAAVRAYLSAMTGDRH
jgi:acyl carrier protein